MACVKGRLNKSTELRFIALLRKKGITGWRRNYPLVGKPDFVFPQRRTVVFIDGCFWHGCTKHCRMPSSNIDYWNAKIERNKTRDKQISKTLKEKGWNVIRIWEHAVMPGKINRKLSRIGF
jgi:DNA mismatch endonuclease (patch repair protein)